MRRSNKLRVWRAAIAGAIVGAVALSAGPALAARHGDDRGDEIGNEFVRGRAKNVILYIGDGMGDSEITIARNYAKGAAGDLVMDLPPFTGEYTTYAVQNGTADVPDYVTDSAASGTGWATGHKTYNNAISVDPVTKEPLQTILERAQAGRATRPATSRPPSSPTRRRRCSNSHITLRGLPGPGRHGDVPDARRSGRRPRVDRRADRRPRRRRADGRGQGTGSTRPRTAGPTVLEQAQAAGLPDRDRLQTGLERGERRRSRSSACSRRATWTSSGPVHSRRPIPARRRRRAPRRTRLARRSEPHLSDMTAQGARPARPQDEPGPHRASSSRSRARRSTSRTTRRTRVARSVRRSSSTGRSRPGSWTRRAPEHARHRDRRPRPHEPDRRGADRRPTTARERSRR